GEESFRQRVVIAGHDVGAAALEHQAGQAEAAAQFEDPLARYLARGHGFGQLASRGPDMAEHAPLGRGNPQPPRVVVRIGDLLQVDERADPVLVVAKAERADMGVVTGHWRSLGNGIPEAGCGAEAGGVTATWTGRARRAWQQ